MADQTQNDPKTDLSKLISEIWRQGNKVKGTQQQTAQEQGTLAEAISKLRRVK